MVQHSGINIQLHLYQTDWEFSYKCKIYWFNYKSCFRYKIFVQ